MVQAILFDLDDTLFSLRGCEAQALRRTLDDARLLTAMPANYNESYATISSGYWASRSTDLTTKYTREDVVELSWRDFLSAHDLDESLSAELAQRYWTEFCRADALNPGAKALLQCLSPHYRLGMITNGYSDSQRGRLGAAGLLEVFDPLLISEEVGVAKPDVRIFKMALTHLGLPPEAVLYVGDSISHDREGCLRAGIDFCHYCPSLKKAGDLPQVKFRVAELTDLISLLLPNVTP